MLWLIIGKEVIKFDATLVVISIMPPNFRTRKTYLIEHIQDLRVSPSHSSQWVWDGSLAFHYGAKTIHFAWGADEAEAKQILATIVDHFPELTGKLIKTKV